MDRRVILRVLLQVAKETLPPCAGFEAGVQEEIQLKQVHFGSDDLRGVSGVSANTISLIRATR
jgi:hypothetical protein